MEDEIRKFMEEQGLKEKALKVERYRRLNKFAKKGQILFVGSSLMEQFPIDEMQRQIDIPLEIYNRGIGGYVTTELLDNIDACILELEPKYIFINIGTNDISGPTYNKEELLANYGKILDIIKDRLPDTKVTLLSYYPTNPEFGEMLPYMKEVLSYRSNERIKEANEDVKEFAEKRGLPWVYVNDCLMDDKGYLKEEFAIDGMHFFANGYKVILENMLPMLKELH